MSDEVEVRCCCRPENLYGWLTIPANVTAGDYVAVCHPTEGIVRLEVATYQEFTVVSPLMVECANLSQEPRMIRHRAIKSMERPIEFFRAIRGFRENPDREAET